MGTPAKNEKKDTHYTQTYPGIDIRMSEKTVPETVNKIKERIEFGNTLPECGQRMDGIKNACQKSCRHNQEILETGQLIIFVCPYSGNDTDGSQNSRSEKSEKQDPEWRMKRWLGKPDGNDENACCHDQPANNGCQHIRHVQLPVRNGCKQYENKTAIDFRLDQGRR